MKLNTKDLVYYKSVKCFILRKFQGDFPEEIQVMSNKTGATKTFKKDTVLSKKYEFWGRTDTEEQYYCRIAGDRISLVLTKE